MMPIKRKVKYLVMRMLQMQQLQHEMQHIIKPLVPTQTVGDLGSPTTLANMCTPVMSAEGAARPGDTHTVTETFVVPVFA